MDIYPELAVSLDQYTATVNDPRRWMKTGDDLLASAFLVYDMKLAEGFGKPLPEGYAGLPFQFVGSFLMLSGFAIENMLKGLRVYQMRKTNESAVVDGKLNPKLKTHDLFVLADATGILRLIVGWEIELLSRLAQMVRWAGRYPVDVGHGTARQPGMLTDLDRPTIEKFVTHIRAAEREFWVVPRVPQA